VPTAVESTQNVAISFAIPLAAPLGKSGVHFVNIEDKEVFKDEVVQSAVCLGSAARPEAKPGNLCVYETALETNVPRGELEPEFFALEEGGRVGNGAGISGTIMRIFRVPAATESSIGGYGAWAVTAEE
jgi:hypothetical protein